MKYHLYTDDTQLYLSFQSSVGHEAEALSAAKAKMEACIQDMYAWMSSNILKLETDKILLVLNAKHRPWPPITSVSVCDDVTMASISAKNIGVVFDSNFSMETNINTACKAALFYLRNLTRICKYLSTKPIKSTEILVHALITSKINFCNALRYGT